jgi:hypothetical protein
MQKYSNIPAYLAMKDPVPVTLPGVPVILTPGELLVAGVVKGVSFFR